MPELQHNPSQDGSSEEFIGDWMEARGNRDQIIVATKVGLPSCTHLPTLD